MSHPTWVRGLKSFARQQGAQVAQVAPHVGAWIEIPMIRQEGRLC